ncbi:MAG: DUF4922 domain-containing protein [Muribaculaceae bacterium]|nr:DUF4922 domain-containing protein [Muribaculaceae bacterium]
MIDFIDAQLTDWPLARENYQALGRTERRSMQLGDLTVGIQHNPARIVSTGAKTDAKSIGERPCFLCKENRPPQQTGVDIADGWELLLNPYPIFPSHFTIVSTKHQPQEGLPLDMVAMAEKLPGHTVFFNGRRSGASCPDHLHCQAVKTHELPLMCLIERSHALKLGRVATSESLGLDMPFAFKSVIITPDIEGMSELARIESTIGKEYIYEGRINVFVWIDHNGLLRICAVPRKAHRPSCYGTGQNQRLISPGCIDMAGVLITPVKKDYDSLTEEDVRQIYGECAITPKAPCNRQPTTDSL